MSGPHAAIHARGLRVVLGSVNALDGLDLHAPAGAVTALLGPNGAGKTTFVRAVATLQPLAAGQLTVAGVDAVEAGAQVRRRVGLAGQHAAVVGSLTARENLALVARLYGLSRRAAARRAREVADALGLGAFLDRRADACSGGQRRRLDLAASLVGDPAVLLLDEPTAGLDPHGREALWDLVAALPARGTAVLLTTQYLEEAAVLAQHVVLLDRGRVVTAGAPAALRRAAAEISLSLVTEPPVAEADARALARKLGGELDHRGDRVRVLGRFGLDEAYAALQAGGLTSSVTELQLQPPTLDEVFFTLTRGTEQGAA